MALRPGELSELRAAFEQWMTSTATILRRTQVADTSGGFTDTYAAVGTYPCSFTAYPITPVERESTTNVQTIAFWRFRFPAGADVRSTDRLTVGTRTFEVVQAGSGSLDVTLQAICQEIS